MVDKDAADVKSFIPSLSKSRLLHEPVIDPMFMLIWLVNHNGNLAGCEQSPCSSPRKTCCGPMTVRDRIISSHFDGKLNSFNMALTPSLPCHIKVRRTHTFKCIHACYAYGQECIRTRVGNSRSFCYECCHGRIRSSSSLPTSVCTKKGKTFILER